MLIGRAKNDLKWNYGVIISRDKERGRGLIFAIWFFKQKERTRIDDNVMADIKGFHKSFRLF